MSTGYGRRRGGIADYVRRARALCALLLFALLVNAARVQVVLARQYDDNPANRTMHHRPPRAHDPAKSAFA